ncbi:uncharacterized protein LOC143878953 [Tasmannia lanceolata]|uniref:uncharacterized protein LOC143878953 n=1 Tax=Tasmannia lanceolata TaxID=3420 RepID=UPI004064899E
MWLQDTSLYPIIERAWTKEVWGNPMYRLSQKLKEVKFQIKNWNRDVFGRIDIKVPILRRSLQRVQQILSSDPTNSVLIAEENKLLSDLITASSHEESLYRQKSRVQWLDLGDSNTKFFHSFVKNRLNSNSILASNRNDGSISSDPSEIETMFVNHFHRTLNNGKTQLCDAPDPRKKLTPADAAYLSRPITNDEGKPY